MQHDSVFDRIFRNRIAYDLDFSPVELTKVKCNYMPKKRQKQTSYLIAVVMCALSITVYELFAIEICMTLTLIFIMDQDQM